MWQEKKGSLYREFIFRDFKEAFSFMQSVADEAEKLQHHPRWENVYNRVEIWLSTHEAHDTITDHDRQLAKAIDSIYKKQMTDKPNEKKTSKITEIKLYADGGSRGNPGPSASGYVLLDMDNKKLVEKGIYLGVTTNNQAEYRALKFGLEEAQKMHITHIDVYMDSLLVINQMIGKFKIKNRDLWPIHDAIKKLAATFEEVSYTHVPRELNKLADAMVNKALDAELGV
jgi:ribonuclease HI/pterin-4a-carbinolamine dehydratase